MEFKDLIIYTDVDGTVATNHNHIGNVSKANINAFKEFMDGGGLLGVASGRNYESIDNVFEHLNFNLPYIEANGTSIWDNNISKHIYKNYVSKEFKKQIYNFVKEDKTLTLTVLDLVSRRVIFNDSRDNLIIDYKRPYITYDEYINSDILKCAILAKEKDVDRSLNRINELKLFNDIEISRSATIYLEFFDKKSSKGEGIKFVLDKLNLGEHKLVCIGDYYNDISMLEIADIAICPLNAVDEVKKVCDYITLSNEDDCIVDVINYLRSL